jgi:hypothetical protein
MRHRREAFQKAMGYARRGIQPLSHHRDVDDAFLGMVKNGRTDLGESSRRISPPQPLQDVKKYDTSVSFSTAVEAALGYTRSKYTA